MGRDHLAHLRAESTRFADVLANADPSVPVPSCPDWTAADLLWHLGEVQHFWGTVVRDRLADRADYERPVRPEGYRALRDFFDAASSMLTSALASTPDEVPVWTWFAADRSVGFVRRRQAHEALIHRLDAELTSDVITDVDPELATDGVLEVIEWMFGVPPWATATVDGPTGRLVASDTGADWRVQVGRASGTSPSSGETYTDEPVLCLVDEGAPSFEVAGTARDLDAWLWNRPPVGDIVRTGDTAALDAVIVPGVQ
ncbi:maleylpyruvate isomerase family mycothiol-dependent enzyme [soil metagenome]